MIDSKGKEECCGCGACEQICPVHAIVIKEDSEGFLYPSILKDVCIKCNRCEMVCPFESDYTKKDASPEIYAAINNMESICKKSSSGGVFTAVSNWILEQHGVVFGVKYDDMFQVVHAAAQCVEDRNRFRGSKYVQSNTDHIYMQVELELKRGIPVLFSGTPCQVEALNKYMRLKSVDIQNLYTIDNICHGVASPRIWANYVEELKKMLRENEQLCYLNMRSKNCGWRRQEMEVITNQRNISQYVNRKFSWNRLFLSLFITRPSCFFCRFTSYKRCADLTLADYWNYENAGLSLDDKNGVSLVMVNTKKGKKLFSTAKKELQVCPSTKEDCWQIHLQFPNNEPSKRGKFWRDYERLETLVVLKRYVRGSGMNKIIRAVSPVLRRVGLYTLVAQVHHRISRKQ